MCHFSFIFTVSLSLTHTVPVNRLFRKGLQNNWCLHYKGANAKCINKLLCCLGCGLETTASKDLLMAVGLLCSMSVNLTVMESRRMKWCEWNPAETYCDWAIPCHKYKYQGFFSRDTVAGLSRATRHPLPTTISNSCPLYSLGEEGGKKSQQTRTPSSPCRREGGRPMMEKRRRQREKMRVRVLRCEDTLLPNGEWRLSKCVRVQASMCEWRIACHWQDLF